jgi:adenylate cyclase
MANENKRSKPGFIQELQRRKVFRVAVAYLIVAWLVIQIADTTFDPLQLPEWSQTLVVVLAMIGFPVALVLAWAFDATPDGIKKTEPATDGEVAEEENQGPSIAVLPFVNMSDSKENEYFSDGLAEELLTMLSRITSLKVCSRSSSFAYKGKDVHVPTVAAKLGVKTIVEGSVRRVGDKVRITVQVIDAKNDKHLWAKNYDRKLDDIFAVQDEIAEQIVQSLHLTLSLEEQRHVTDQTTENFEAYDYYLRGKDQYYRSGTGHLASALRMFDKAIEIDPGYALAYAGRTYCLTDAFLYRRNEEPTLDRAFESSSKAVELADHLAESHTARGLTLMAAEKFSEAKQSFERALSISPTLYEPLNFYSRLARLEGDPKKVLELARRAAVAQPDNYQSWSEIANQLKILGRDEEAVAAVEQAQLVARKAIDTDPTNSRAMSFLAIMLCEQGNSDEAKLWIERALVTAPDTGGTHYNAACGYALLGETELALDHLERGINLGAMHKQWYDTDPDMDSLRDEPRYKAMMKRV